MRSARDDILPETLPEEVSALSDDAVADLRATVARIIRKICPSWLADEADDLTQIATTRVLERMRATSGRVAFSAGYVYRAVHSALVDEIRNRRRLREVPIDPDLRVASPVAGPDRHSTAREIRDAIIACLGTMLAPRRRAVTLHLQGHSLDEVSVLLECDRRKAENLVYRGLADLRGCLGARGVVP